MTKNLAPTLVDLDSGMHPGMEVKGLMKRSILISDYIHGTDETDMDKPSVTIVVDQALYTKVRASSADPDLERIVLPMGAMPSMLLLHILL